MFAVAGGGIQNFEILYKFLNSNKAEKSVAALFLSVFTSLLIINDISQNVMLRVV